MKIAVIGLGKIGLPLAVQYARKGNQVTGVDTNEKTVKSINLGIEPFPGEAHLAEFLEEAVRNNSLSATSDYQKALESCDVVVIATPLLINENNEPDFSTLDSVAEAIGSHIDLGTLVILETTVPIGTTRNRLASKIQEVSSLKASREFFVAFSPERVFTGRIFDDLKKYPKLVGGIDVESGRRAKDFYENVLDFVDRTDLKSPNGVWLMESAEAAEFVKLAETTYRDVNIALANQFAKHASQLDLDIFEMIQASNSQPFCSIHSPGISVGGHCIPVYPYLYLNTYPEDLLVRKAREINENVYKQYINIISTEMGSIAGLKILIMGLTYRPGVKETTLSGTFPLTNDLREQGAQVVVLDPLYGQSEIESLDLEPFIEDMSIDVAIIHTAHSEFASLNWSNFNGLKLIIDGRGILNGIPMEGKVVYSLLRIQHKAIEV